MYIFKFADIGEGIHEGKIGELLVKVNEKVKEGQNLFIVETDKITTEITSPVDGVIEKILVNVGDLVRVGQELFHINDNSGDAKLQVKQKIESKVESKPVESTPAEEPPASVIGEVKVSNNLISSFGDQGEVKPTATIDKNRKILISPIARMIARENKIDLNTIQGSGPSGRILRKDLENTNSKKASFIPTSKPPINKSDTIFPITTLRKTIARNLKNATANIAYTNLTYQIDVTTLWSERNKIKNAILEKYNLKLSVLPFIVKAIALTLESFPLFNAIYDDKNNQIILKGSINIGIAIDTKDGLIVPNIKNANYLSVIEIAQMINDLATKTKNKSLTIDNLSNGSFSITNYGSLGAFNGTPIIKYPELAIAGIGTIYDVVKNENNQLVTKNYFNLTIAADHQWIDGGDIARFAKVIQSYLENILKFLL